MSSPDSDAKIADRTIELRLPSRLGYEKVAMDMGASLARWMGFHDDRIEALRTALAEAVTNAIEHGNSYDADIKVTVLMTLRSDELIVSVTDEGRKHLDQAQTTVVPRIEDALDKVDKGGWGIWLIRELMDEVEFSTDDRGGNRVRMVIHLER